MLDSVNILVVDDEQIVLDSLKRQIKNEPGCNVFTATSVEEGLEILSMNKINIILTDLMMAGIDGIEFFKILKEKNQNALVIMITGYATINTALQVMQLGAFDYLAKPFTREELLKVLKRACEIVRTTSPSYDSSQLNRQLESDRFSGVSKGIGEHSWLKVGEDGNIIIGVERPLLYNIGRIQSVYLPSIGDEIRQGCVYFQIFSADLQSFSLLSPLSGIITSVNANVLNDPNDTLQDPYGTGWLIKIKPMNFESERKIINGL